MVLKMEAKLRDLETDLENEQRKTQDVIKQQRKQERKQKEIAYQVNNHSRHTSNRDIIGNFNKLIQQ